MLISNRAVRFQNIIHLQIIIQFQNIFLLRKILNSLRIRGIFDKTLISIENLSFT